MNSIYNMKANLKLLYTMYGLSIVDLEICCFSYTALLGLCRDFVKQVQWFQDDY